jgi:hypothetical protein
LTFWEGARRFRHPEANTSPTQQLLDHAALLMVGAIGVTGEPIDPATDFDRLSNSRSDPGFLSGSVQPMTLRSIAILLANALPAADQLAVGEVLQSLGDSNLTPDRDNTKIVEVKQAAFARLATLPSQALDSYPVLPLFYIHLQASQRSIDRDIQDQVSRWKRRDNIPERRVHTDKLGMLPRN